MGLSTKRGRPRKETPAKVSEEPVSKELETFSPRGNKPKPGKYPKIPIPLDMLGDACAYALRRIITDALHDVRCHKKLERNQLDLMYKLLFLQQGVLKNTIFRRSLPLSRRKKYKLVEDHLIKDGEAPGDPHMPPQPVDPGTDHNEPEGILVFSEEQEAALISAAQESLRAAE